MALINVFKIEEKNQEQKVIVLTNINKKNFVSIGNCGEYFVAAELERHGFTVAVPMSNTKDFDILAISREIPYNQFAIQVKTSNSNKKQWILSRKNEQLKGNNIFYIFVSLNDGQNPSYHIVPSEIVAKYINDDYNKWLNKPGKNGIKHNDNTIRKFRDLNDTFLNRWDLLLKFGGMNESLQCNKS